MSTKTTAIQKIQFALGLSDLKIDRSPAKVSKKKFAVEVTGLDGTTYQTDALEEGSVLYEVGEDGSLVPASEGVVETDDCVIEVGGDGTIDSIEESSEANEGATEDNGETEDMKQEDKMAEGDATSEAEDNKADAAVLEAVKALAAEIATIKADIEALKGAKMDSDEEMKKAEAKKEEMRKAKIAKVTSQKVTKAAFSTEAPVLTRKEIQLKRINNLIDGLTIER